MAIIILIAQAAVVNTALKLLELFKQSLPFKDEYQMNNAASHIKPTPVPPLAACVIALSLTLTACGGGGSSTTASTPSPTPAGTPATAPSPVGTPSATPSPSSTPSATPAPSGTPSATPTPTPTPVAAATPTAAECPFGDYRSATLSMINSLRAVAQSCGVAVGSLNWSSQLETAAAVHSNDMAVNNYFAHPDANNVRVGARVQATGYSYSFTGENIAAGQTSVNDVFNLPGGNGWMSSPSHCANIMTASHRNVGISCKYNPSSTYQYYWTLVMAD